MNKQLHTFCWILWYCISASTYATAQTAHEKAIPLLHAGQLEAAVTYLNEAILADPQQPTIWLDRALALEELHRYAEAFRDYSQLVNLEPQEADPYYLRGLLAYKMRRWKQAQSDLLQALRWEPSNADAWMVLGKICWLQHKWSKARYYWQKSMVLRPGHADAMIGMALYEGHQHHRLAALKWMDQASTAEPGWDWINQIKQSISDNNWSKAQRIWLQNSLPQLAPTQHP